MDAEEVHSVPNGRSSITVMDSVPCASSSNAVHVLNVSGQCARYAFHIIAMKVSLIRMSYSKIVSFNVILQYRQYLCRNCGHMFSLNMDNTSDINIIMFSMCIVFKCSSCIECEWSICNVCNSHYCDDNISHQDVLFRNSFIQHYTSIQNTYAVNVAICSLWMWTVLLKLI